MFHGKMVMLKHYRNEDIKDFKIVGIIYKNYKLESFDKMSELLRPSNTNNPCTDGRDYRTIDVWMTETIERSMYG